MCYFYFFCENAFSYIPTSDIERGISFIFFWFFFTGYVFGRILVRGIWDQAIYQSSSSSSSDFLQSLLCEWLFLADKYNREQPNSTNSEQAWWRGVNMFEKCLKLRKKLKRSRMWNKLAVKRIVTVQSIVMFEINYRFFVSLLCEQSVQATGLPLFRPHFCFFYSHLGYPLNYIQCQLFIISKYIIQSRKKSCSLVCQQLSAWCYPMLFIRSYGYVNK